jgi:hypothetical protein
MYPHVLSDPSSLPSHQAGTFSANRGAAADEISLALTHAGGEEPALDFQPADLPLTRTKIDRTSLP